MIKTSGPISFQDINEELGNSPTANISLGDTDVRALAEKYSGPIKFSDFRGQVEYREFTKGFRGFPTGASTGVEIGNGLAISDDGLILALSQNSATDQYVWIYTRTTTQQTWNYKQRITLPCPDYSYPAQFDALNMSGDGSVLVVGAYYSGNGEVYTYVRQPNGNYAYSNTITPTDATYGGGFGYSTAISQDGQTLVVSQVLYNVGDARKAGRLNFYTRNGNGWSYLHSVNNPYASRVTDTNMYFGKRLSISADGGVVVATSQYGNPNYGTAARVGVAAVYERSGNTFSKTANLSVSGKNQSHFFASNAVISPDGKTIAVNAPGQISGSYTQARVYIWKYNGSAWAFSQTLQSPTIANGALFGTGLAFSQNGRVLTTLDGSGKAGVRDVPNAVVFYRQNGSYVAKRSYAAEILYPESGTIENAQTLAMSADGSTLVYDQHSYETNPMTAEFIGFFQ